jgi:glycosyltransferase involved in cell wall biosynthesis
LRIDQYIPTFAPHDAIGNHTLQVRRMLREAGYESEIFAENTLPPLQHEARPYLEDVRRHGEDRLLLYQSSTSSPMAEWLSTRARRGEELLSNYHNMTPAEFFARWEPAASQSMARGREELAALAPVVGLALADSAYNEAELREVGYRNTTVCPLLVDLDEYHQPPDPGTLDRLRSRRQASGAGAQWLFVGRIAPNKCQHDVIGAFAAYRRIFDPGARLALVGGATSYQYLRALHRLCAELGLGDSVEFVNGVGAADLLAYWAVADVFVCLSEHEGFCIPVLEAMELGVPVVAYASTAVPETLGGAGLLLEDKDPLKVAEAVETACHNRPARERLIEAGQARASQFSLANNQKVFLGAIEGYLDTASR